MASSFMKYFREETMWLISPKIEPVSEKIENHELKNCKYFI